jgi:Holliday junction resolvasome RuvABC endonuclease subunit
MIILSLDPGETTGYAIVDARHFPGDPNDHGVRAAGVISKWRGIRKIMDAYKPVAVVAEQYRLYPGLARAQSFSTMVAARVLGVIEFLCESRNIPLIEQAASVGKSYKLPPDVHKMFRNPHVRDCLRHAMAYIRTQG